MNVVAFPGNPPNRQQVLETVYKFNDQRPSWRLEVLVDEEGQPFVEATHAVTEVVLGFHWKPSVWAVSNANSRVLEEDNSLDALMAAHLR